MSGADPTAPPEPATSAVAAPRPSRRLVGSLVAAVVLLAVLGYARTGSPRLAGWGASAPTATAQATAPGAGSAPETDAAAAEARQRSIEQIASMVDGLAARMKERPDDAEGWTMLARSYVVLGRFADALPAYRRASELQPRDAGLLADFADATAATVGTIANAESARLVERALAIDPQQPKARALAGTLAYERGDFAGAAAHWQKIADALPADSEFGRQVRASIDEARQRAGAAGALPPSTAAAASAPAPAPGGANASVRGTVSLDPALAGKAAGTDTVFVFARAADGGRMPLAIQRGRVADLPLAFSLDDSMAMSPAARLSGARSVVVAARISRSGNAMPQPGDLIGESAPVAPGATGLTIRIDRTVGEVSRSVER